MQADAVHAAPQPPGLTRRSVTMPIRAVEVPGNTKSSPINSSDAQYETLLVLPYVRVVAFNTQSSWEVGSKSKIGAGVEDAPGTLPWRSALERLIAVGPLRIYRPLGSVAFLNCGKVMHPILAKSQCWCVDDDSSKFVLQIRRPQYWRIEVPMNDEEDIHRSEEFRAVLAQVLQFEKTACPFTRNFVVELPELPEIQKRPWKPVERPKTAISTTTISSQKESGITIRKRATTMADEKLSSEADNDAGVSFSLGDTTATTQGLAPPSTEIVPAQADSGRSSPNLAARRNVSCPPHLNILPTTPPRTGKRREPNLEDTADRTPSPDDYSSSVDSFHSVQSWHSPITPLPPSPPQSTPTSPTTFPYPHEHISFAKQPVDTRPVSASELTATPDTPRVWDVMRDSGTLSTTASEAQQETDKANEEEYTLANEPPTSADLLPSQANLSPPPTDTTLRPLRRRPIPSRIRSLSPLPPTEVLIASPKASRRRPRHLQTRRHLPTAILQKTCEILLSPPSHLLRLMLEIAARIRRGEWRELFYDYGDEDDGELVTGVVDEDWEEDDFGVKLSPKSSLKRGPDTSSATQADVGGSWEVD